MGGGDVFGGGVRVIAGVVCCIGACAGVVSRGDSCSLVGCQRIV